MSTSPNEEKLELLTIIIAVLSIIAVTWGLSLEPIQ